MKARIIKALKDNAPEYVSGEHLSELLGVSRTAVWKYINELKKEGYVIESSSKKGYMLAASPDLLNEHEVGYNLKTGVLGKKIYYFHQIDSTNNFAKRIAYEGCEEGTVVIADLQTAGRGRLGRNWDSAAGKGIWMSVVLKPDIAPEDVQTITLAASVAVVRALEHVTGIRPGIKWPNDLVLDGKKVCGILTEMNSEIERVNFLVLGVGINVNHDKGDFPQELKHTAESLRVYALEHDVYDKNREGNIEIFSRSEIIKRILFELELIYSKIKNSLTGEIIDEWRRYSVTLGRMVRITAKSDEYTGTAIDITSDGKLVVSCADGIVREVISGEVSVRGIMGYTC